MYKERKEKTHGDIGEEKHTSSYICENKDNVCHKKNGHKTSIQKDNVTKKEIKVHKILTTSLKNINTPLNKNILC